MIAIVQTQGRRLPAIALLGLAMAMATTPGRAQDSPIMQELDRRQQLLLEQLREQGRRSGDRASDARESQRRNDLRREDLRRDEAQELERRRLIEEDARRERDRRR